MGSPPGSVVPPGEGPHDGWMRHRIGFSLAMILVLGSCTTVGSGERASAPRATPFVVGPDPSVGTVPLPAPLPEGVTFAAIPAARYVPMFEEAGAEQPAFVFGTKNWSGSRASLLVLEDRVDDVGTRWLRVQLPVRPNGRSAWIRDEDVRRLVERRDRIVVDLSSRTLRYFREGELVNELRVGIGSMATPTATGTFSLWVKVGYDDPSGPYGTLALGLSGFSPVLKDWPGGGRLAIHGTDDPSDRGRQVSHGCIRVYNPELRLLRDVRLGTPVTIKR